MLNGLSCVLCFCAIYFCASSRILGFNSTFQGLYTPCTFQNIAAIVKLSEISDNSEYAYSSSSGDVYILDLSDVVSAHSSSHPVIQISTSNPIHNSLNTSKYFLQIEIFSSKGSTDKSSICEEKSGLLFFSKYFLFSSISPSIQGSAFLLA